MAEARPTAPKRCTAARKDGQPCTAPALPDSAFCFAHDPTKATERDAARRRGGANSANVARLRGLVPPRLMAVYDKLETALDEVHDGRLEPRTAGAMASLAGALVKVLSAGELEERVRKLEGQTP